MLFVPVNEWFFFFHLNKFNSSKGHPRYLMLYFY
nr:MAG TPA: hypothetical protein [Caudoviricetes sp.]